MKNFNTKMIIDGSKEVIEELGYPMCPFSSSHFNSEIIEAPNGKKIQVQVTVTTDEDEFVDTSI